MQTQRSLTEGASLVVSADPARVDPANDGKLVHVSGDLKPGAPLTDPDFTVSATALRLVRTVEMYQWKEEIEDRDAQELGGSEETVTTYEYHRVWSESRNDSSRFKRPEGHINPQMALPQHFLCVARRHAGRVPPGRQCHRSPAGQRRRAARAVAGAQALGPRQGAGAHRRRAHLSRRQSVRTRASATCGSASRSRRPGPPASSAVRPAPASPSTRPRPATAL